MNFVRQLLASKAVRLVFVLLLAAGIAAGSFLAGAWAYKHRARLKAMVGRIEQPGILQTTLYNLRMELLSIPADGRDGGIAPLGDGILFANRHGAMWYVDAQRELHALDLRVPVNEEEFLADPFTADVLYKELFGVKDIFLQPLPEGVRLLASHYYWHADRDCIALRVSALETTAAALMDGTASGEWRTVFETTPCLELELEGSGERRVALGVGGRVAALSDSLILMTVGAYEPHLEFTLRTSQDSTTSWGKTILIDLATGESRIYTMGHRNPQGLAVDDTVVWLTEHGARGGDELNRLEDGANYGYPLVTYGTYYESMTSPLSAQLGRHEGYDKPVFAWAPSIATSQLIVVHGDRFEAWQGDLIVSSLKPKSLYRVHLEDGHAVLVEPMLIDQRIRDIVQVADGSIVLKTDDDFLVYLSPLSGNSDDPSLAPEERGAILAAQCAGCHGIRASGIAPPLEGVFGRNIGSIENFIYSDTLREVDGRWTEERLRAFLTDPQAFAPGTLMSLPRPLTPREVDDVIAYLRTLD